MMTIYQEITKKTKANLKQLAILIDPDKSTPEDLYRRVELCNRGHVDLLLVGGSLVLDNECREVLQDLRNISECPVLLFPGNTHQLHNEADGILLLSLISGRNPELLIGKHVEAAAFLKNSGLELIPAGYILVDGGRPSAVNYMSQTLPIPRDQDNIAVSTAMAGEMLGHKLIYLEAGSGAAHPVPPAMIRKVRSQLSVPLVVGGGIRTPEVAGQLAAAGADIVVVGNAVEEDPGLITDLSMAIHSINSMAG